MELLFLNKIKDLAAQYSDDIKQLIRVNAKWYQATSGQLEINFGKNIDKTIEIAQEIYKKDYNIADDQLFKDNLSKFWESLQIASTTSNRLSDRYQDARDKLITGKFAIVINNCINAIDAELKDEQVISADINDNKLSNAFSQSKPDLEGKGPINSWWIIVNDITESLQPFHLNRGKINIPFDIPSNESRESIERITSKSKFFVIDKKSDRFISILSDATRKDHRRPADSLGILFEFSVEQVITEIVTLSSIIEKSDLKTLTTEILTHHRGLETSTYGYIFTPFSEVEEKELLPLFLELTSKQAEIYIGHWLMKLTSAWVIEDLKKGEKYWFHTHRLGIIRPDYSLFQKIKPGDRVLGYSEAMNSIICLFRVTMGIHLSEDRDEIISLEVDKLLRKPINFVSHESFYEVLSQNPMRRLFEIANEVFEEIIQIASLEDEENIPVSGGTLPYFYSEGRYRETKDQLDFESDIDSIAKVISLKSVEPPLAIGLFGNWGTGKSFFMEKLSNEVDNLVNSGNDSFIRNVVHVKFNSWHYSDSNLWASLVTEIFDSLYEFTKGSDEKEQLKKIAENLQIAMTQRQASELKEKELTREIQKVEIEVQNKRRRLEDISGVQLLKLVLSDERIKKDLSKLKDENIESLVRNVTEIEEYIEKGKEARRSINTYWNLVKTFNSRRWIFVICVIGTCFIAPIAIKFIFKKEWEATTTLLVSASASVIALLAQLWKIISPVVMHLNGAIKRLKSIKQTLEQRPEQLSSELIEKQEELKELQNSIEKLNIEIENLATEIEENGSGKKLFQFIIKRSQDEAYLNQLGLISLVRKDFKRLDQLLRLQYNLKDNEREKLHIPKGLTLRIDRIILYIDDLDRCNEDIVVKVLEAVHLLLAFPLFVVIVGVDPRWLNNALTAKYHVLFGDNNLKNQPNTPCQSGMNTGLPATSIDYLEKIFQIPFSLKPLNRIGREKLIAALVSKELDIPFDSESDKSKSHESTASNFDSRTNSVGDVQTTQDKEVPEFSSENKILRVSKDVNKKEKLTALTFSRDELSFMQKIAELFGHSPRTINRYLNIYRIIKSHRTFKSNDKDYYIATLLVLSIVIGYSHLAQEFIKKIKEIDSQETFGKFINNSKSLTELKIIINPFLSSDISNIRLEVFKKNIDLIARFSFRTIISNY